MLRTSGAQQVDLVGHSMGGLVAAFYVNALGGHTRVRRLVTLGAPWKGTATWVFGGRREARDMAPDSDVVKAVQELKTPTTAILVALRRDDSSRGAREAGRRRRD